MEYKDIGLSKTEIENNRIIKSQLRWAWSVIVIVLIIGIIGLFFV